jgi:UDP-N-acetylmuramyl pentapeptide phosphotransferase/UDP-N-acetylglucosamine-1-phosphate transferase
VNITPRRLEVTCYVLAAIIVAYWITWFTHRSLVASSNGSVYVNFEQAFPLADGFIVVFLLLAARALHQRSSSAVLFLLLGAGAGFYLGAMDVLYDIEHDIWSRGSNGLTELAINILTFSSASVLARWVWLHRRELDRPRSEAGHADR